MKAEKKILVVEDEIIVAEDIRKSVQQMGYHVPCIATSGEEAVKKAQELLPDLVLMDIMLEGKMDGIEAAEQIHTRFNIPVVYLTAYSDKKTLERAKITEPFGYIIKPFKERELQIALEIALYKHKLDKRLKESEQWLAAVIKGIGDAVIATDPKGIIKIMNPIAEAMTGWKQGEAEGNYLTNVLQIISEVMGRQAENPVTKVIREGVFYGLEDKTALITRYGVKIPVDVIGSPVKDKDGNIIGIVVIFYDILERKRIEEKLKKATESSL